MSLVCERAMETLVTSMTQANFLVIVKLIFICIITHDVVLDFGILPLAKTVRSAIDTCIR